MSSVAAAAAAAVMPGTAHGAKIFQAGGATQPRRLVGVSGADVHRL
eukprot:CAMPEP_0183443214 /NCGR_PEP_ID=MMETSP0370-20130417/90977_1 /TAXON_ID=268820 /ORGANISM="Peridinium aciculiferum, Strain PAER-2" /LENGTH=45 /DNA_ID= /DNA_START= /DNA_END= /DNA_ORIENTATION=